jgi:opacity protein-like surface antigen
MTMKSAFAIALFLAVPARAVPAENSRPGRLLLAPKLGLFEPTSRLGGAFYAGIEVGYAAPLLGHALAVVLEFDWYRPKASGAVTDPRLSSGAQTADGSYQLGVGEFGVLLSAVYRAEDLMMPGLTPYGGLGPGLYSHRAAITAFGSTNIESETRVGLQLLGGIDWNLGPGAAFAEVRYHFARVDFVSTGNASTGGFLALGVGYRLRLF